MKKLKAVLVIAVLTCICLTGCGSKAPEADPANDTSDAFTGKYVVDTEYVKTAMDRDDVVFVDARGIGGGKKTLEGAITMTWQQISKMPDAGSDLKVGDAGYSCTLDPADLSVKLGEFGLDPDKEIIIFSSAQEGWGEDGRIAWQLITAGYTNVKIVDGGISAIEAAELPTQKGPSDPTPCEVKIKSNSDERSIDTEELHANLDKYKVVDSRSAEEYSESEKPMYDAAKAGHIPGSVLICYTDLFNSDGTIKSNDAISKMLEDAGITKDDQIVTYCTGGIRSAYEQLIFEMCGYNVKNDDESFWRWAAEFDTEME